MLSRAATSDGMHGTCAAAMAVFARLLLHNGNLFLEVFAQAGSVGHSGRQWPDSFLQFLDQWLDRCEAVICMP